MRKYRQQTLGSTLAFALAVAAWTVVAEDESAFKPLLNGKDLTGWVYNKRAPKPPAKPKAGQKGAPQQAKPLVEKKSGAGSQVESHSASRSAAATVMEQKTGAGYQVENGVVFCTATDGGMLFTEKDYGDFILRFEFKIEENSNNGIGIRVPFGGHPSADGMEIQILDDNGSKHQTLRPAQYHGSIYDVIPARTGFLRPTGQWNEEEIAADRRHIRVTLNGVIITDADLGIVREPEVLKRHPGLQRASGHIGFLGHDSRVEFRNIRVRELGR